MSKIEVCSRHIGKIVVTTRAGEVKELLFKDCSSSNRVMGVAEVDEDVADVLLSDIGDPEYFKSAAIVVKENTSGGTVGEGGDEPPVTGLTKETYETIKNANTLKAALKACADRDLLMDLISSETQGKNRDTFVNALNAQLETLK